MPTTIELPGFAGVTSFEQFRRKVLDFLRDHEDNDCVRKLRSNEPLVTADLAELQRVMVQAGVATESDLERAARESYGIGGFVRSLVGMDRDAAKAAFGEFLADRAATASQIEFVNLIVEHVVEHGLMDPAKLWASPFTDISPTGPEGIFGPARVDALVSALHAIEAHAMA